VILSSSPMPKGDSKPRVQEDWEMNERIQKTGSVCVMLPENKTNASLIGGRKELRQTWRHDSLACPPGNRGGERRVSIRTENRS